MILRAKASGIQMPCLNVQTITRLTQYGKSCYCGYLGPGSGHITSCACELSAVQCPIYTLYNEVATLHMSSTSIADHLSILSPTKLDKIPSINVTFERDSV